MNIKAITFDFWNTLAQDSAPAEVREMSAKTMADILGKAGIRIGMEKMLGAFAQCRQLCYLHQEEKGIDLTPKEQLDWIMDHFGIKPEPSVWNNLFDAYTTTLLDVPPMFADGLEDVLRELKGAYKLAVICNTGRTPGWVLRKTLKDYGMERYFDALIFSNEVGVAKPNPYIFHIAARMLELEPYMILHIGDHLLTDVAGASGAGFRAGWYNPLHIDKEPECDLTLNNFSEILRFGKGL